MANYTVYKNEKKIADPVRKVCNLNLWSKDQRGW